MKIFDKIVKSLRKSLRRKWGRLRYARLLMAAGITTPFEFVLECIGEAFGLIGLSDIRGMLYVKRSEILKRMEKMYSAEDCYILKEIKIPLLDEGYKGMFFMEVMSDILSPYLYLGDNYDVNDVGIIDETMPEGFYFYCDRTRGIDLRLRPGDIVIDSGAWIGDFSAYASVHGAQVYAFEPVPRTFEILQETACLNKNITPVNMGLGVQKEELPITVDDQSNGGATLRSNPMSKTVKVQVTTLDDFVEENKLERVDFIKADIEGYERFMLQGAENVLKKFGPRLALCTYHLPDDPQVLEKTIKEINPAYEVIQRRKKLFAYIP